MNTTIMEQFKKRIQGILDSAVKNKTDVTLTTDDILIMLDCVDLIIDMDKDFKSLTKILKGGN